MAPCAGSGNRPTRAIAPKAGSPSWFAGAAALCAASSAMSDEFDGLFQFAGKMGRAFRGLGVLAPFRGLIDFVNARQFERALPGNESVRHRERQYDTAGDGGNDMQATQGKGIEALQRPVQG